jgi:O-antigen/teichoic acid export membrane protein
LLILNKLFKNTLFLYIQFIFTTIISLYIVRKTLLILGIEDYGIFTISGGLISSFSFLNTTLSNTTQRFISYTEGEGDINIKLKTFNTILLLHILIGLLVFLIFEFTGFYFFKYYLNISENKIFSAKWVYQFAIISSIISLFSVPYESVLSSHENMIVYSLINLFFSIYKLVIIFIMLNSSFDKLILYSFLFTFGIVFKFIFTLYYCKYRYKECNVAFSKYFSKAILKKITYFISWNFTANFSGTLTHNGQTILLNKFFNFNVITSFSIANQISIQLKTFSNIILKAIAPIIVKFEANNNRNEMFIYTIIGTKLSFLLFIFFTIPVFIEIDFILEEWLGNIPSMCILFCKLQLIKSIIEQLTINLGTSIEAVGKIKRVSFVITILNIFPLPISYFLFFNNFDSYWIYIVFIIFWSISIGATQLFFSYKLFDFPLNYFIKSVIIKLIITSIFIYFIAVIPTLFFTKGYARFFCTLFISSFSFIFIIYNYTLNIKDKNILNIYYKKFKYYINTKLFI